MRLTLRLIAFTVAVAAIILTVVWLGRGPDPAQFAHLKDPRITRMPDEKMLVVEASGDPNLVASRAFKQLFGAYYKLNGVSRSRRPPAPRARWPRAAETQKQQWVGHYALPVPSDVSALPTTPNEHELSPTLSMWTYGEVAEILHVGSYSSEEADITRLLEFVRSSGYHVIGEHEEEYVRGPGMLFAGNPGAYLTIIRVRVKSAT